MNGQNPWRSVALLSGAVAFGVSVSVLKGNTVGPREGLGNISAPWLILPYLVTRGVRVTHVKLGATVGALSTLLGLLGFYLGDAVVFNLGGHDWQTDVSLTLRGGRLYFLLALITGPIVGVLTVLSWRGPRGAGAATSGALFLFEPLVQVTRRQYPNSIDHYSVLWPGEVLLGAVILSVGVFLVVRVRRPSI